MNNRWDEFDCSLATSLSELPPPEETIQDVNPFRAAIGKVLWGLALTSLVLNAWYLQYLLPAIGTIQLYLGFRSLRNNNRWFRACWIISICKLILLYLIFLLSAVPHTELSALVILSFLFRAALLVFLHLGLRQAAAEVGYSLTRAPALWALVWNLVLAALAFFHPVVGWLTALGIVVSFVCILAALAGLAATLGGWGYAVRAVPVRIGDGRLAAAYLLFLAALVGTLSLASSHLPVESQIVEQTSDSTETIAIRENLTSLGFPKEWLALLPEDELQNLAGAEACQVHLDAWGDSTDNGVRYTDVQVLTAPNTVRCYHFFTVDTRKAVLQNLVQVEPDQDVRRVSDVAGQLLWQKNEEQYAAPLPWNVDPYGFSTALFSYPFATDDRRGWCAYTATLSWEKETIGCSILHYQTQALRNLYPYAPLPEQPIVGMLNDLESQSYSTYDFPS